MDGWLVTAFSTWTRSETAMLVVGWMAIIKTATWGEG